MKTKKKYGIGIFGMLCVASCVGIMGIIAWTATSVEMGGRGMTPGLLLAIFVLFLMGVWTGMMASEALVLKECDKVKIVYKMLKQTGCIEETQFPDKDNIIWSKGKRFCLIGMFIATPVLMMVLEALLVKSILMALFMSVAIMHALLFFVNVLWDMVEGNRLRGTMRKLSQNV